MYSESKLQFLSNLRILVTFNEKFLSLQQLCLHYPNTKIPQVQQYLHELSNLQNSWESFFSCMSILCVPKEQGNYPSMHSFPIILSTLINSIKDLQQKYRSKYLSFFG